MKVLFLGNHTFGVRALEGIREVADLVGVVAHPWDPEDGVRYESVFDYAEIHQIPVIRSKPSTTEFKDFLRLTSPELIWVTDYKYLLPKDIIDAVPGGAVNIHPSLLPNYRGRASLNWAIINDETTLGVTFHKIDEGMDTGGIIEQISFKITDSEYIEDVLRLCEKIYYNETKKVLQLINTGALSVKSQKGNGSTFPRRRHSDGEIDWEHPTRSIFNLIRAVSHPYPGAFSFLNDHKMMVWRSKIDLESVSEGISCQPGEIVAANQKQLKVATGDGHLIITDWDFEYPIKVGERLRKSSI